ncbi:hypothetical protein [Mycobacteroides abscessus]|uniref:hypothetical protein n=1 Tax=Mycobacteroides abscessus TaxID=36809 RepID=UPI000927D662|nr:hypothetical protein [Mycobacteroides abscessus]QSM04871.1 hypothetical protein PROPHIGD91-4_19 [Mycobacterium phage prophi91-4]MDO3335119.1 hypothetical protein [Mycobacteroides abscessus subsp. bolletii]QSM87842.1 hypothetical protein I3U44_18780 [Mycobacteroides abscessus subsp. bolletii]SIB00816.1 Uncharacterised protein [Mycobacteroides abscessus subsp. bolletii]SII70217.1 Uncharacterised protein [Mycobacteroides abscessus subsp. bolletii]
MSLQNFDDSLAELIRDNAARADIETVASARAIYAKADGEVCLLCEGHGVIQYRMATGVWSQPVPCSCVMYQEVVA